MALRSVQCVRDTSQGPWPVSVDECPLRTLPAAVVACNTQPCLAPTLQLRPAPGLSACEAPGCSSQQSSAGISRTQLIPLCVATQLPGQALRPLEQCGSSIGSGAADWAGLALLPGSGAGNVTTAVSLAVAAAAGSLRPTCGSLEAPAAAAARTQACTSSGKAPLWVLGAWGGCSALCGGGTRTRAAVCHSASNGLALPASDCEQALGALASSALSERCNVQPCQPAAWKASGGYLVPCGPCKS